MKLYAYFRSSAAYRVRIALGLKGQPFEVAAVNLLKQEQRSAEYRQTNPQALVPSLELDSGEVLGQSVAILEWLEETHPTPALYARDALERAAQRSLCSHIACDIHPLNNLRILRYLGDELAQSQESVSRWYAHWVREGFNAVEMAVAAYGEGFSLGERPGMVEAMVIPQLYNARRFKVPVDDFPAILSLDERCQSLDAFHHAHPGRQPDTPEEERI